MEYKILVSCANGLGTSMIMKMAVEQVVSDLGMKVKKIHHCAISEARSNASKYDIVFCPINFVTMFEAAIDEGVCVIGVKNVLSQEEMKEKLKENGFGQ